MTKEEILAMEAGEELDRLVATEVMEEPIPVPTPDDSLRLQLTGSPPVSLGGNWVCLCRYSEGDIPTWHPLPFSKNISAAWLVVEKVIAEYGDFIIDYDNGYEGGPWSASVDKLRVAALARTAPEAICKAALLAKHS